MRRVFVLAAVTLACAPVARAAPVPCAGECTVFATEAGYVPAVMPLADGDTVTWSSLDTAHPTADMAGAPQRCFVVPVGVGSDQSVRFRVIDGTVRATSAPGTPDASTKTCSSAIALPAGGFVLPFMCSIHPQMRGALVVQP